jgi:hypothetical protein
MARIMPNNCDFMSFSLHLQPVFKHLPVKIAGWEALNPVWFLIL